MQDLAIVVDGRTRSPLFFMDSLCRDGQQAGGEVVAVDAILLLAEPQIGEGDHFLQAGSGVKAVGAGLAAHGLEEVGGLLGLAGLQKLFGQLDLAAEFLHGAFWLGQAAEPGHAALAQVDIVLGIGIIDKGGESLGHALGAGVLVGLGGATG